MSVHCIVSRTIKLSEPTKKLNLAQPLAYTNAKAHSMEVVVVNDDGTDADLTGIGCTASFKRSDNTTVEPINGTVSGNVAQVILPASCYVIPGRFTFTMDLSDGNGATRTVLWVDGMVEKNTTSDIVDPGTPVGNIEQAIGNANAAASAATTAATAANTAATNAANAAKYTAPTEASSTASKAYAVGDYFVYNGKLYITTSAIASGGTITPNTNCAEIPNGLSGEVGDLKSAIESAFIICTASGAVACIADGADSIPFKTLTANIDSEQAPVSGWAEVNVTRAGKNLIDGSGIIQGGINEEGVWATSGKRVVTDYIRVNPGMEYVASIESGKAFVAYRSYDINKQVIESANITTNPYTVPNNAHFVRIIFKSADNSDIVPSNVTSAQLEFGHVATTYEPYTAQTISVDLEAITGGTVYSGTLTINSDGSGVVVVDGSGEPVSYEFTASQFTSFLGDNNVWCDAGQVTVEYQADTKLYIDTKIAELQALVLENINS